MTASRTRHERNAADAARNDQPVRPSVPARAPGLSMTITPRTIWLAAAVVALLFCAFVLLTRAAGVLFLFFAAVIIAEGIRPLVARLRRAGLPRALAVGLVYLAFFLLLALLAWLLIQPLLAQATAFISALPTYITQAQDLIGRIQRFVGDNPQLAQGVQLLEQQIGSFLQQWVPFILRLPLTLGDLVFTVVVVLAMAFFWLTAIDGLRPFLLDLLPPRAAPSAEAVLDEISVKLGGYLRGVVTNMLVIGILTGLGLWILGVPYPALLGILAGLTEVIPFLGPWISGSVAILVALVVVGPLKAVEVVALFFIIQNVEGNTLVPLVMQRSVDLNPLVVIVGVLLGGAIFGLAGSILSVPLAAVIQVLIVRVLAPALRRASAGASESGGEEGGATAKQRTADDDGHALAPRERAPAAT
jgi:predicted PurR-regulated permease PerM